MSILLWIFVFFEILIVNAKKSCTAFLYQNITCADDVEILIAIDDANYTREEAQDIKWMGQLGDYRSPIEFQFNRWQYLGTDGTDMEAAFRTANDEMDTSRFRRTNARSVIIFAAENFRKQGDVEEFLEDVKTFKDNEGIIIVIDFGQDHEYEALFRKISSGGFYMKFSNDWTSFIEQLNTLLCQANCFCPGQVELSGGTIFEPISGPYQRVPTFGCFWRSDLPALETLAEQACKGLGSAEHRTEMAIYREPEQMAWIRETHKDDPGATFAAMQLEHGKWIWFDGVEFNGEINVTNVNDIHATYGPIKGEAPAQAWGFATIGEKAGAKYVCQTRWYGCPAEGCPEFFSNPDARRSHVMAIHTPRTWARLDDEDMRSPHSTNSQTELFRGRESPKEEQRSTATEGSPEITVLTMLSPVAPTLVSRGTQTDEDLYCPRCYIKNVGLHPTKKNIPPMPPMRAKSKQRRQICLTPRPPV
ncbi:unnamed protein product, partial [Mesorhabditis spiculigera]